jgi:hypothetical protein
MGLVVNPYILLPPDKSIYWDTSVNASIWTYDGRQADKIANNKNDPCVAPLTAAKSTGKWYIEVYLDIWSTGTSSFGIIGDAFSTGGTTIGGTADSWSFQSNGSKYHSTVTSYTGAWADNMTLMMALDRDAAKVWWGRNGVWGASGDPATGANPAFEDATMLSYNLRPAFSTFASGRRVFVRSTEATCVYSPPEGFEYWTDEG